MTAAVRHADELSDVRRIARTATRSLAAHPVNRAPLELATLRHFMAHHVFAVWDFMWLLKRLQARLACVTVPWTPPRDPVAARLVNEIVLDEESDRGDGFGPCSHLELYLEAMREVGASTEPVETAVAAVAAGVPVPSALEGARVPDPARRFVLTTLALCEGPTEAVAAAFFYGREELVPQMFASLLDAMPTGDLPVLRLYLERHIELDGGAHAERAGTLLARVCGDSPVRWRQARDAAGVALDARVALWDAIWRTRPLLGAR